MIDQESTYSVNARCYGQYLNTYDVDKMLVIETVNLFTVGSAVSFVVSSNSAGDPYYFPLSGGGQYRCAVLPPTTNQMNNLDAAYIVFRCLSANCSFHYNLVTSCKPRPCTSISACPKSNYCDVSAGVCALLPSPLRPTPLVTPDCCALSSCNFVAIRSTPFVLTRVCVGVDVDKALVFTAVRLYTGNDGSSKGISVTITRDNQGLIVLLPLVTNQFCFASTTPTNVSALNYSSAVYIVFECPTAFSYSLESVCVAKPLGAPCTMASGCSNTYCSYGFCSDIPETTITTRTITTSTLTTSSTLMTTTSTVTTSSSTVTTSSTTTLYSTSTVAGSVNGISASAVFNISGVAGSVIFSQRSPAAATIVNVSLSGLQKLAGPYHIHLYPIVNNTMGSYNACLATGGHLNPFLVNYTLGACNFSVPTMCEVGDLSGKHGFLVDLNNISTQYTDSSFTLFSGNNSIIGRSVVIHFQNSSRWVCADILVVNNYSETTTAGITGTATITYTGPVSVNPTGANPTDNTLKSTTNAINASNPPTTNIATNTPKPTNPTKPTTNIATTSIPILSTSSISPVHTCIKLPVYVYVCIVYLCVYINNRAYCAFY